MGGEFGGGLFFFGFGIRTIVYLGMIPLVFETKMRGMAAGPAAFGSLFQRLAFLLFLCFSSFSSREQEGFPSPVMF